MKKHKKIMYKQPVLEFNTPTTNNHIVFSIIWWHKLPDVPKKNMQVACNSKIKLPGSGFKINFPSEMA